MNCWILKDGLGQYYISPGVYGERHDAYLFQVEQDARRKAMDECLTIEAVNVEIKKSNAS